MYVRLRDIKPEEREKFLKSMYEYCVKYEWNKVELDIVATSLGIDSGTTIRRWGKIYIEDYMELSFDEQKQMNEYIAKQTLESRKKNKKDTLRLPVLNPVLIHYGISSYFMWNNDKERAIVLEYIYEYCGREQYEHKKVKLLANEFGITEQKVIQYIKEYIVEYVHLTPADISAIRKDYLIKSQSVWIKGETPNHRNAVYEAILKADDPVEISEIIDSSGYSFIYLKNSLIYYKDPQNQELLKKKFDIYEPIQKAIDAEISAQKKQIKAQEKEIQRKAKLLNNINYVHLFINSEYYTIGEFCEKNGISEDDFYEQLNLVKEFDQDLYDKYMKKISEIRNQRYAILCEKIKRIVFLIKNGVEFNGIIRSYDLIDYYTNMNISLKDFLKISEDILDSKDFSLVKQFVNKNISGEKSNTSVIKEILSERFEFNLARTKDGMPIPGSGEIFPEEKKRQLIAFLQENNVPINRKTYMMAFNRYINNTLIIDDIEVKSSHSKK